MYLSEKCLCTYIVQFRVKVCKNRFKLSVRLFNNNYAHIERFIKQVSKYSIAFLRLYVLNKLPYSKCSILLYINVYIGHVNTEIVMHCT